MAQRETEPATRRTERTPTDPAILAAGASVVLSWYYFFARGDRQRGLFVGLWPPTILAFANYIRQIRIDQHLQRVREGSTAGIRESVQRIVQGSQ